MEGEDLGFGFILFFFLTVCTLLIVGTKEPCASHLPSLSVYFGRVHRQPMVVTQDGERTSEEWNKRRVIQYEDYEEWTTRDSL